MLLRSGKVTKRSFSNNRVTKRDFISELPDELLTDILSLLPDADACRTSVLSKRWKALWMIHPSLHFVLPNSFTRKQTSEYYDVLQKMIAIRYGLPIRRFSFYSPRMYDSSFVKDWLSIVVQHEVKILVLRSPPVEFSVPCYSDMFNACQKLVELTLEGQFNLFMPKDEVIFPCLKKISLISVEYEKPENGNGHYGINESFENLITRCCPVLEELFLERQRPDNLGTVNIFSESLKRLMIYNNVKVYDKFVINAPNLEYLYIKDKKEYRSLEYDFEKNMPSLVEAYIDTSTRSVNEIITSISSVKVLTLTSRTLRGYNDVNKIGKFDELNGWKVQTYPNLAKLVIDMQDIPNWRFLFVFLDSMPNLERITFSNGFLLSKIARQTFYRYWKPPVKAPACLRIKLKEIKILNQEAITAEELPIISYMLNQSNNLERLAVNGHEVDPRRLNMLFECHGGSIACLKSLNSI